MERPGLLLMIAFIIAQLVCIVLQGMCVYPCLGSRVCSYAFLSSLDPFVTAEIYILQIMVRMGFSVW